MISILEIFFWEDENNWLSKLWFYKTSEAPTNQNSMIFFEYVDSMANFFLLLYPPFENSTTHFAIV